MNVVCITSGKRVDLLMQTLMSLTTNAADWKRHTLTVVQDGCLVPLHQFEPHTLIYNASGYGASASRNIGAGSIPKYRRARHLMFIDDDVYMMPRWDERLAKALDVQSNYVFSGHAHPYNVALADAAIGSYKYKLASVLSTVHMTMQWETWDDVGYFVEPGGPGGSEDVEWCARARKKLYRFAVTEPMCVMHCGLTSSRGTVIVGYGEMMEQNERLVKEYGLKGVVFG